MHTVMRILGSQSCSAHSLIALLLLCVYAARASLLPLTPAVAVEYELSPADGWDWYLVDTDDVHAVSAGLVVQRGAASRFPRMGFVMLESASQVPPGSLSDAEFDPTVYTQFDAPIGARLQYVWEARSSHFVTCTAMNYPRRSIGACLAGE